MVFFDELGFAANYTVDAEPEYPGDGDWGLPEFHVLGAGLGGPVAIMRPMDAAPWLLSATFGHPGAIYATPAPDILCVMEQFTFVTLIDVRTPSAQTRLDVSAVRVSAALDEQLLLLAGWSAVTAWAPEGIRWVSNDVLDDIHIRRTDNGRIVCTGMRAGVVGEAEVTLDAATGRVIR
jgi:hypothetical protein